MRYSVKVFPRMRQSKHPSPHAAEAKAATAILARAGVPNPAARLVKLARYRLAR
jgi:hypothetical protein